MTEGGIAVGLHPAFEHKIRAGWLSESEVIVLSSGMTEGGTAVGLNPAFEQKIRAGWLSESEVIVL